MYASYVGLGQVFCKSQSLVLSRGTGHGGYPRTGAWGRGRGGQYGWSAPRPRRARPVDLIVIEKLAVNGCSHLYFLSINRGRTPGSKDEKRFSATGFSPGLQNYGVEKKTKNTRK